MEKEEEHKYQGGEEVRSFEKFIETMSMRLVSYVVKLMESKKIYTV